MSKRPLRPDITYMSRRTKPIPRAAEVTQAEVVPASAPPPRASNDGLTLGQTTPPSSGSAAIGHVSLGGATLNLDSRGGAQPPRQRTTIQGTALTPRQSRPGAVSSRLFPAPNFSSVRDLSEENPVVRLNARQAGIGSLVVSGARSTTWEDVNLTTGAENAHGDTAGTAVITPGNRPLVAFHEGSAVIALRHIQQLRRAIFIAEATPLIVRTFGGAAAAITPRNSNAEKAILYISRVGELLELRAEYVADADDPIIWAEFGFRMTLPVNARPAHH